MITKSINFWFQLENDAKKLSTKKIIIIAFPTDKSALQKLKKLFLLKFYKNFIVWEIRKILYFWKIKRKKKIFVLLFCYSTWRVKKKISGEAGKFICGQKFEEMQEN